MIEPMLQTPSFTDTDLDFVVGEAAPDAKNKTHLKQLVSADQDFREALVGDEKVFQRVMADEEILLKISPVPYFEILLRKARKEIEVATYTLERLGRERIPVFDTPEVVETMARPGVVCYLAQMLASFTRIQSIVISVRIRRGIRRRVRYNDMDIDSLLRLCRSSDKEHRFGFYKRIADVCLFVSSIFNDHTLSGVRYIPSRQAHSLAMGRLRLSLDGLRAGRAPVLRSGGGTPDSPLPGPVGGLWALTQSLYRCREAPNLHRNPLPPFKQAPTFWGSGWVKCLESSALFAGSDEGLSDTGSFYKRAPSWPIHPRDSNRNCESQGLP